MRRFGLISLVAIAVSAFPASASHGSLQAVAKSPPKAGAVLAIVGQSRPRLVWIDPSSLRVLRRGSVRLDGSDGSAAFSPAGARLAVGGGASPGLRFIQIARMRPQGTLRLGDSNTSVTPLAWLEASRLLVLRETRCCLPTLLVVDPNRRRVVAQRSLDGSVGERAVTRRHFVFLLGRGEGIGPATFVVADADGNVRTLSLDRIQVGTEAEQQSPLFRTVWPGFAVDPEGERAYVVGADSLVAEIDLATLAVTYHDLSRNVSLLGRLHSWLEPAAEAKAMSGPVRQARWIGDGLIALSGYDNRAWTTPDGSEHQTSEPAGLELIDSRTWTVRALDKRAGWLAVTNGLVLAGGVASDGAADTETGMGVAAYAPGGTMSWHLFGDEPVGWLEGAGGYAYVPISNSNPLRVRVVDLTTGSVLRSIRWPSDLLALVTRDLAY